MSIRIRPWVLLASLVSMICSSGLTASSEGARTVATPAPSQARELCQKAGSLLPRDTIWGTPNAGGRNCTGLPMTACYYDQYSG